MTEWVSATRAHIKSLREFVCAEPIRRWNQYGRPIRSDPWNVLVERRLRGIRPPCRPPDHAFLSFDDETARVEAAILFRMYWSEPGVPLTLSTYVVGMAVHNECRRRGLASELLVHLSSLARLEAHQRDCVQYAMINAEVHVKNEACQELIKSNGWVCVGPDDTDENYEKWIARLEV